MNQTVWCYSAVVLVTAVVPVDAGGQGEDPALSVGNLKILFFRKVT